MKQFVLSGWLAALVCNMASGCVAQEPNSAQAATAQSDDAQALNRPVSSTMTCGEFKALLKDDERTGGTSILWLDGYYSGRSGLPELPAGWVRTVSQGIGGICAISVNDQRTCLTLSASSIGSMPAGIKRLACYNGRPSLFGLFGYLFFIRGCLYRRWLRSIWRQEHDTRPVLIDSAISNVDRDAKSMGEIAGSAG